MEIPKYFFSCDWGTSNFRLRLVRSETLTVVHEHTTDFGVKKLYEDYQLQKELNQIEFFSKYLKEQVAYFPIQYHEELMVLSGMASSSIGLKELAYSDMPLASDGSSLIWEYIEMPSLKLVLISGARTSHNVMRGEEVQAVGLSGLMTQEMDGLLLLPGTHSKHISFRNGQFTEFRTYMTGEMFNVISTNSILANSLIQSPFSEDKHEVILKGIEMGLRGEMTSQLFSIRVNELFGYQDEEDNYYLLSGMLIGDELSYLKGNKEHVYLSASPQLTEMYRIGLHEVLGSHDQVTVFSTEEQESAVLAGQLKVLKHIDTLNQKGTCIRLLF